MSSSPADLGGAVLTALGVLTQIVGVRQNAFGVFLAIGREVGASPGRLSP